MACVFCHADLLEPYLNTTYGSVCDMHCASAGFVCEAVKCAVKVAPCIGHCKTLCAGVLDLIAGNLGTPNVQKLHDKVTFHHDRCTAPECTLPHTLGMVVERILVLCPPPPPPPAPPAQVKHVVNIHDAGHVLQCFSERYAEATFIEDLKSIMRGAGVPDLQQILDPGTRSGDIFYPSRHACTVSDVFSQVRLYRHDRVHIGHRRQFTVDMKTIMRQEGFPELQRLLDQYIV